MFGFAVVGLKSLSPKHDGKTNKHALRAHTITYVNSPLYIYAYHIHANVNPGEHRHWRGAPPLPVAAARSSKRTSPITRASAREFRKQR